MTDAILVGLGALAIGTAVFTLGALPFLAVLGTVIQMVGN